MHDLQIMRVFVAMKLVFVSLTQDVAILICWLTGELENIIQNHLRNIGVAW